MDGLVVEKEAFASLGEIENTIWNELAAGVGPGRHAWHLGVLATCAGGRPRARTVVLRSVCRSDATLAFHTDIRSAKVEELKRSDQVEWVFYSAEMGIQLRLSATAAVETGTGRTRAIWESMPDRCLRSYATIDPPGTPQDAGTGGVPPEFETGVPARDLMGWTAAHFAVVDCKIHEMDFLFLRARGHQRAKFYRSSTGAWSRSWVVP